METVRAAVALLDKPDKLTLPENSISSFEAEDEFNNITESLLPLPGYSHYQPQFDYYARTRRLEVDSPRIKILQGTADKMTAGTGVTARVVIMNKGKDSQAFVTADGTIFINQALINNLESLDEVAGILAHEVGHRINKTHEKKGSSRQPEFAVGWIHEAAADNLAPHLLEKVGYNSFGLARAITKISTNQRDSEHQTGEARATQATLQHGGIHFATSDQELTPLPQILRTDQVTPTNIEIMSEVLADYDVEKWGRIIPCLHPADLGTAYVALAGETWQHHNRDQQQAQEDMLEKTVKLMTDRLRSQGLSEEYIDLYFLSSQESHIHLHTFSMIQAPEELVTAVNQLDSFIEQDILSNAQQTLFNKSALHRYTDSVPEAILKNLTQYLCDVSKSPNPRAIPVTQDSFVAVLQKIHEVNEKRKILYSNRETELMSEAAAAYITNAHSLIQSGGTVDSEVMYQFFLQLKELGIPINQEEFTRHYFYKWGADTTEKIVAAYQRVFPVEKNQTSLEAVTEQFLQKFAEVTFFREQKQVLEVFLKKSRALMDEAEMSDGERKVFLDQLRNRLGQIPLIFPTGIAESLHLGQWETAQTKRVEENIYRFNFDLVMALSVFQQDGNEFYDYIANSYNRNSFDSNQLTWFGLANTCVNLLHAPSSPHPVFLSGGQYDDPQLYVGEVAKVTNIQRLLSLPLLQNLIKRQPQVTFAALKEFNEYVTGTFSKNLRFYEIGQIYDDSLPALILGQHLRYNAQALFRSGIKETEYDDLFEFINNCMPAGQERSRVLRQIKRHFLRSQAVDLDQKTEYIIRNFDDIGPEGMLEVADQITTLADYRKFHGRLFEKIESYLNGSMRVTELAVIDNVSSRFVNQFNSLLMTAKTDGESRRKSSTDLARTWYDNSLRRIQGVDYDSKLKKIILGSTQRQAFQTLGDLIDNLQHLTSLQRFAITLKAMVDKNGAMTSQANRQVLGETITDALRINSTFINLAVRIACVQAPADFASLPAAQILAPLLFKNLDTGSVTKDFFESVSDDLKGEIRRLMKSSTRDVTLFGISYFRQPQSYAAKEVLESDRQYREVGACLADLFPAGEVQEGAVTKNEIDPSYEAVISGVENSGPLGTRGLQLARQLVEFSPPVDRRLARSLDRMRGLNKLLFWENILKLIDDTKAGRLNGETNQPQLVDFLEHRLVSLGDYLGGGSLYTTYAARVLNDKDELVDAVVKMLRPNPGVFIKTAYKTTSGVFSEIESNGSEKDQQYARMGQVFIDLAQQWCLKDILDPSFERDDDGFRTVIDAYNAQAGRTVFYAPERMMTTYHVKSETMAAGKTLNQLLEDSSVRPEVKKKAVGLVIDMFRYQLRQTATSAREGQTENIHLVHSDPHVGNYIVDTSGGSNLRIGVVDRSMYLKLTPEQAKTFDKLLSSGDYRGFVSSLIDQVMDYNKVINDAVRKTTKNNIISALTKEYFAQKLHSLQRFSLDVDNFVLLRKMLDGFDRAKLDIPLEIRLMIKNVESLRELQRRYR